MNFAGIQLYPLSATDSVNHETHIKLLVLLVLGKQEVTFPLGNSL